MASKNPRRNAISRGKRFEAWCADKLRRIWPGMRVVMRGHYGVSAPDLEDERGDCAAVFECKKRGAFPAMLEKSLTQARGYLGSQLGTVTAVVILGNTMSGGRQEARVYMDLDDWIDLEEERIRMKEHFNQLEELVHGD
jgi:hypothetical protein